MKIKLLTLLLVFTFLISGCYTQLETIHREPPQRTVYTQDRPTADRGDRYDDYYYSDDEWAAYEEGYYDGVFDTELAFRDYRRAANRYRVHVGWSRAFYGYGFSYGYYYDPHWRWAQLYDPYYYAYYGYYAYPYHMRYRHFAFFYSPFWGPRTVVYYNNWHYYNHQPNYAYTTGPRTSGVHRGNTSNTAVNRTRVAASGLDANRSTNVRSRVDANRTRPAAQRSTVDRNRGTSSRGTVTRTPQRSPSQGNVGRTRGSSNTGSGNVGRSRGSSGSSATPQRSRNSGGNDTGRSRSRGGDELSAMQRAPVPTTEARRASSETVNRTPQARPDNNVRQRSTQPRMMPVPPTSPQTRPVQSRTQQTTPVQSRTQQAQPAQQTRPVQSARPVQNNRPVQTTRPAQQTNRQNVQPPQRTQRQVQAPAPRPANNTARQTNQRNNSQPAVRSNTRSSDNDRSTNRSRRD